MDEFDDGGILPDEIGGGADLGDLEGASRPISRSISKA